MGIESGAHQNRSRRKERDSGKNDLLQNPLIVVIVRPRRQGNIKNPFPAGSLPVLPA